MQIPGWSWTLLIALIPPVVDWLQHGEFSASPWAPAALILLGAIAKLVELAVTSSAKRYAAVQRPASFARRFFFGG